MKTLLKCLSVILCFAVVTGVFSSAASAYYDTGVYVSAENAAEPDESGRSENAEAAEVDRFLVTTDTSDLTRAAFDILVKVIKTHPEFLILLIPETIIALIQEIGEKIADLLKIPSEVCPYSMQPDRYFYKSV